MDESFKLSEQEHERIYRQIEADFFKKTYTSINPRAIITGGQTGSGKSSLLESSKADFPDQNVVVINGDELRNYHPARRQILELDDRKFAERTDPDSRVWTKRLFDKAIETGTNIIFESTMREAVPLSETMKRLRDADYHITAKVMAVHEGTSKTSIISRYEEQKAARGYGRWSKISSHDAGYEGMPKTVMAIEKNGLVNRLEVYNRQGEQLYANDFEDSKWKQAPMALKVIETERKRPLTNREKLEFKSDWARIHFLMNERKATKAEQTQVRKIESALKKSLLP